MVLSFSDPLGLETQIQTLKALLKKLYQSKEYVGELTA